MTGLPARSFSLLVAGVSLALPLQAQAAPEDSSRWQYVGRTADSTQFEIDRESIATVEYLGDKVKGVWVKATYIRPQMNPLLPDSGHVGRTLQLTYYDCSQRRSLVVRIIAYRWGNDAIVDDLDQTAYARSLQAVVPQSVDEAMMRIVCRQNP